MCDTGGFFISHKIQSGEHSNGSGSDGIAHKLAPPRERAKRLVLQPQRPQLELARQQLQLPRRASLKVISSSQPLLLRRGLRL